MLKSKLLARSLILVTFLLSACADPSPPSPTVGGIRGTVNAAYTAARATHTVLTLATPSGPAVWREYISPTGKFKVLLPEPPTEKKVSDSITITEVIKKENSWRITIFEEEGDFSVVAEIRDSQVRTLGGKLLSEQGITLGQIAGKEFDIELASGVVIKSRVFKTPKTLYLIQSGYTKDNETSLKENQQFFNSFQLI